jgi:hypothetical protein
VPVALLVFALFSGVVVESRSPVVSTHGTVNLIVGDASVDAGYVAALGGMSVDEAERERVAGHLRYVLDRLARVDTRGLEPPLRYARAVNLGRLARYIERGVFPRNDDHLDARRPTFVDARGRICAVGALFEADRGHAAAIRIARDHKYAFITEIDDGELAAWQRASGLTALELAMIQPAYAPEREHLVLPFAVLDRLIPGPGRVFTTTELAVDDPDQHALTVHVQQRIYRGHLAFDTAAYATLPLRLMSDSPGMAGGATAVQTGTGEAGMYFSFHQDEPMMKIIRVGVMLPTGTADDGSWLDVASARTGDAVLALPRSAGGRGSFSSVLDMRGYKENEGRLARVDSGIDVAKILDGDIHVVPRAGLGAMRIWPRVTTTAETSLAWAPSSDGRSHLRWSGAVAGRLTRAEGFWGRVQPALIAAVVRTIDGWTATATLDLSLTLRALRWSEAWAVGDDDIGDDDRE